MQILSTSDKRKFHGTEKFWFLAVPLYSGFSAHYSLIMRPEFVYEFFIFLEIKWRRNVWLQGEYLWITKLDIVPLWSWTLMDVVRTF